MKTRNLLRTIMTSAAFFVAISMSGCAFGNSSSWKEEVLLHDGRTIIVKRSQTYGEYAEPAAREKSLAEETWEFNNPDTKQEVIWKNDYGKRPENSSLMLILLDFMNGVPYMATRPAGCISYNNWKRPNPPYVFLKYDGTTWRQIQLSEFPAMFKNANVVVGRPDPGNRSGTLSIAKIKEDNRLLEPHLKRIVREPIRVPQTVECEELIFYKGVWIGPGDSIGRRMMDRKPK